MSRRQPKPEPITPEEVMDSPALQGLEALLHSRSAEELAKGPYGIPIGSFPAAEKPGGETGAGDTPAANYQIGDSPTSVTIAGDTPMGLSAMGDKYKGYQPTGVSPQTDLPPGLMVAVYKPGPKIHRASRVQDGHSVGEQAVYLALWNAGSPESPDTRLIRIGYGGIQSLCGLDKTNCKDNIQSLIRKLAIEIVSRFSVEKNQGNTYRIFSGRAVLKRRQAAGMEWVIRNKGVRFVDNPDAGDTPIGDSSSPGQPSGDYPTGALPVGNKPPGD